MAQTGEPDLSAPESGRIPGRRHGRVGDAKQVCGCNREIAPDPALGGESVGDAVVEARLPVRAFAVCRLRPKHLLEGELGDRLGDERPVQSKSEGGR